MIEFDIRPVRYSADLFAPMLAEAPEEGGRFLLRLEREWIEGTLRFDRPGEILLGAFVGGKLVGIGGLSHDPYALAPGLGRVRHLYVLREYRRRGIGRAIVQRLLDHGRRAFSTLRLTTQRQESARLYESFGFERREAAKQTHLLELQTSSTSRP